MYEPNDPLPKNLKVVEDWRDGHIGDWVLADDDCVIQVLRRGQMLRSKGKNKVREYIGTCTGTFPIGPNIKMDTSKRINIYSFGGNKNPDDILLDRTKLSKAEQVFVLYMAQGLKPEQAYIKAFPTNNIRYAKEKSTDLIKTERVKTAMKEELKPVLKELGVDETYILKGIKSEAETAEKSDTRLKALFKLSDIMDLEDKNQTKVTQISGAVFKGFDGNALEEVQRPKEIEE
ncbi:MAG: hypothetical protein Tp152DCM46671_62 [Prokaryotic dsDNA virus sp.]|nr:MAG: hypothetical protein Tp152DCM46671_62 [Prokaryotic dsDNA virus sp.]